MSGVSHEQVNRTAPEESEPEPEEPAPKPRARSGAEATAEKFQSLALFLAPFLIAALAGLLYLYVQSLNLDSPSSPSSQRSALNWGDKLWPQTVEQLQIAFWSTLIVIVVAVPLGIGLTRPALRRYAPFVVTVANSGQALPAYGLLVIFLTFLGQGQFTAIWALALFALLPVLRNTMVGLGGVDRSVIEAGRGMGMTKLGVLARVEMPLAVPIIIAGVRTAMIINIGMATLAFLIGGGGLGITINAGLKLSQEPVLIVGAWLVALVALSFDWAGALAERYLRPRGI